MKSVSIIDYGCGNILSIKRAVEFIGFKAELTSDSESILKSDSIILPGVGAFGNAINLLKKKKLINVIKNFSLNEKKPLLGICLGMQLLLSKSFEFGEHSGLNLIPGEVIKLSLKDKKNKIPHIGWKSVFFKEKNIIFDKKFDKKEFYFVHSFVVQTKDINNTIATCKYYERNIASVIKLNNILGCQFHPEKSRENGLEFLKSFCSSNF